MTVIEIPDEQAAALRMPPGAWEGIPEDGASQHGHYIYGLPKREP